MLAFQEFTVSSWTYQTVKMRTLQCRGTPKGGRGRESARLQPPSNLKI